MVKKWLLLESSGSEVEIGWLHVKNGFDIEVSNTARGSGGWVVLLFF